MNNTIPTPEEVLEYFSKAKEIRCLSLDIPVNIVHVSRFNYDAGSNSYTSNGGVICVWKDNEYATILKKKCGPDCKGCKPCQENKNQT